ncbi:uncharacterized protein si:dkey-114l24.2 isoform X1 [Pygocentrus nattereri]|uniref:uncharacterized protein si:dkey-114l24.2 isoform X1 n=1 Tax=Pygocentrus nattereri TaxID=42514 RepID=UPI001890E23B|nr:uncharacterized protein si:dkey-114l24.2 isoform X1 [Pygocentrus nattereri]
MWAILCICICVWACDVSSSPLRVQREARLVMNDEVNVLMYGVLQFSESLHHMYQSTAAKLARVTRAISNIENVVQRLGRDTEQAAQSEGQIKEGLGLIQAQMAALQAQSQQYRGLVNRVELEDAELKQKLINLEVDLNNFTPNRIKALQEVTKKHNTLLDDLISWTQQQKQQLESQNQQLAELQKQTNFVS